MGANPLALLFFLDIKSTLIQITLATVSTQKQTRILKKKKKWFVRDFPRPDGSQKTRMDSVN